MSRSRRHAPVMGNLKCASEQDAKRLANRALRRRVHVLLDAACFTTMRPDFSPFIRYPYNHVIHYHFGMLNTMWENDTILPHPYEVYNPYHWIFGKDGKGYHPHWEEAWAETPWQFWMK